MKKLLVAIIAFLSVTTFVNAQTVTTSQPRTAVKAKAKSTVAPATTLQPAAKPAAKAAGNAASTATKATAAAPAGGTVHLKKDGTVDRRFKNNGHLKKDGTPDMRYKENKKS